MGGVNSTENIASESQIDTLQWERTISNDTTEINTLDWNKDNTENIDNTEHDNNKEHNKEKVEKTLVGGNEITTETSPFISQDLYKEIMKGGYKLSETTSDMKSIESISISTTINDISSSTQKLEESMSGGNSNTSEYNIKMYGFSESTSPMNKQSNNYVNSDTSSYKVNSSSINTSDIQLVSENISENNIKTGSRLL